MADIFLSYARDDETRIKDLVAALEAQGWSVFWDRRIPAGETWRSHIGAALQQAHCVIVAWSTHSIESQWVAEEADDGKARRALVPVLLDKVTPPHGFREIQAADLSDWRPGQTSERFAEFIGDVRRLLARQAAPPARPVAPAREPPSVAPPVAPSTPPSTPPSAPRSAAALRTEEPPREAPPALGRMTVVKGLALLVALGGVATVLVKQPWRSGPAPAPSPTPSPSTGLERRPSPSPSPAVTPEPSTAPAPAPTTPASPRRVPGRTASEQPSTAPDATRPARAWLVIAGSFRRDELAAARRRKMVMAEAGFPDAIVADSNEYPMLTPDLWVVALGPYATREEANAALGRVNDPRVPDAYVKRGR